MSTLERGLDPYREPPVALFCRRSKHEQHASWSPTRLGGDPRKVTSRGLCASLGVTRLVFIASRFLSLHFILRTCYRVLKVARKYTYGHEMLLITARRCLGCCA